MGTTIQNGGTKTGDPADCLKKKDILHDYKKHLQNNKTEKNGIAEAAKETTKGYLQDRNGKVCFVLKAEEAVRFYRNIDLYVGIQSTCVAEAAQKNVDEQIKKSDDLAKALQEVSKSLKTLKDKAAELKAKACELDTQLKDDCNREQLRILNCNFEQTCGYPKSGTTEAFTALAEQLIDISKAVCSQASKTFNDSAQIAGIQTFSNVKSLKDMSKMIGDAVKSFKTDVDTNVKDRSADETKDREELAKAVKELTVKKLEQNKATTCFEGIAFTVDFLCSEDNCLIDDTIPGICAEVMSCFCETPDGGGGSRSKPEYEPNLCD